MSREPIELLPGELQARLQSDSYFCDVPVVAADEGNVLATIQKMQAALTTQNGKCGVAVIVLQVVGDYEDPEMTFGPMRLRPSFQVIENRELNLGTRGTGKSARAVARRIVDVITSAQFNGLTTDMTPDKPCIEPITLKKEMGANLLAYQVNFWTVEADTAVRSQAGLPALEQANGQFTLSTATDGAEIWYTTDLSYPLSKSVNPKTTALLYAAPVDIPDGGVTVRAAAYKAGIIGSGVLWADIA